MARIQQLSPLVISQIAAGEVIERPASVVKELLENSIDAGSTRIDVEVGQGGIDFVRVVDNGCGIDPDDLPLAFAAHATSKLRSGDDLFRIGTLGFRGEGLASIGGISQVTLQSRQPERPCGAEIGCHGGALAPVKVWNGAPGTRIEVRHLFFNTPVRRKFLKGPATEMAQVSEVFTRLALSNLSLHLTLRHNSKVVYDVPSSAGLLDRIAIFFGAELRDQLLMVEAEQGSLTLGGYVADPICERGGSQMQYLFVNGRWIRDRGLSQALLEAYRGLLLTQRHPVAFLFLELPPEQVDVNVHPTKAEIRFRNAEKVQQLVQNTVRGRLQGEDLTARLCVRAPREPRSTESQPAEVPAPTIPAPQQRTEQPPAGKTIPEAPQRTQGELPFERAQARALSPRRPEPPPAVPAPASRGAAPSGPTRPAPTRPTQPEQPGVAQSAVSAPPAAATTQQPARVLKAIQMHDLYLLVEVPEGVLIIDQHALHERILFEQLKERYASGRLEVQRLLIPEPVNLTAPQAAAVLEHQADLAELGVEVQDFGGGTVLLSGYPSVLGRCRPREILQGVVEYLMTKERPPSREALLNDLLSLIACHSAVRAGDRLTPEMIAELAAQRDLARDTHHCPHGRPTSLLFTRTELDRQFRRT
jgi:DNA mismatch repair protein MutL